jgi:hypothetical protein
MSLNDLVSQQYKERLQRFEDAIAVRGPDRIPVIPNSIHYYPTRTAGMSAKDATYQQEKRYQAWKEMILTYEFDLAPGHGILPGQWLDLLQPAYYKWPGGGLADHLPFQYVEKEFLRADEYDSFLANPTDFTLRVLWPRKAKLLEPFARLPAGEWFGIDPISLASLAADPEFVRVFDTLKQLGEEFEQFLEIDLRYTRDLEENGFAVLYQTSCHVPYDVMANSYRGMAGAMMDMYRAPEKLTAAMDLLLPSILQTTIRNVRQTGNPRAAVWLHRGADGFMSDEQFQQFYWPGLKAVVEGLLEADVQPILFIRGNYTTRLNYLTEFPRGRVPLQFDMIDRKMAREVIGGKQCFCSNVGGALLALGTPAEVRRDVREIIDLFGDTGGLIIDGQNGIPDEAKPENLRSMVDAALEFGA